MFASHQPAGNRLHAAVFGGTLGGFVLLLGGLMLVVYWPVLLGGQSFFYRDFGVLGYPFLHHHKLAFWAGEVPLWNPLSNCGVPFAAQWGTTAFYPLSLIYLMFPMPWSVHVFCLGHLALGGAGMFLLARRWMGSGLGPVIAGAAFVFGGVAQSSLMWPNYTVAMGWMPWVLLGVINAASKGGRFVPGIALIATMQMLAGVPEIVLLTWVMALGLVAAKWKSQNAALDQDGTPPATNPWAGTTSQSSRASRAGEAQRRAGAHPYQVQLVSAPGTDNQKLSISHPLGRIALVVLLVSGLCALQLLPFFELLGVSQRQAGISMSKWPMPLWGWGNLVVPSLRYFETYQGSFVQAGQSFFTSYYAGLPVLLMALYAVWHVRRRLVLGLALTALLSMVLALGDSFPPNQWLRSVLPVAGLARYPVKMLVLMAFSLPLLAGFGVQSLVNGNAAEPVFRKRLVMTVAAGLIGTVVVLFYAHATRTQLDAWDVTVRCAMGRVVFLTGFAVCLWFLVSATDAKKRLLSGALLVCIVWLDLLTQLPVINPTLTADHLIPGFGAAQAKFTPQPTLGAGRVFVTPRAEELLLRSEIPSFGQDFVGKRLALWSNLNVLDGVPKVNGSSTLRVAHEDELQTWIYDSKQPTPGPLLDMLGVTYQSAAQSPVDWERRETAMPWITAGQKPVFANAEETRSRMMSTNFSPRTEVLLPLEARTSIHVTNASTPTIRVDRFDAGHVTASVNAPSPTMLVIAQTWHPNWRATMDGRPAPILQANHAFQAVEIPMGCPKVELVYQDNAFAKGACISFISAIACALWLRRVTSSTS